MAYKREDLNIEQLERLMKGAGKNRVTHRSTRREAITGEDGTDRTHPKGDRNLYKYGFQGTVRGSRVQNREIEDGGMSIEDES